MFEFAMTVPTTHINDAHVDPWEIYASSFLGSHQLHRKYPSERAFVPHQVFGAHNTAIANASSRGH